MQLHKDKKYTYADYVRWNDGTRYELIDGTPYMMSPAPSPDHQRASLRLALQIGGFLKGKPCELFTAPFDVRLAADANDDTVVQPDLAVICDHTKIDARGCNGAPDLILEIVSPASTRHDQIIKFNKYLQAGVREYWVVNPQTCSVQTYLLKDGEYVSRVHADADVVPVSVLEGCTVDLAEVFPQPVPQSPE